MNKTYKRMLRIQRIFFNPFTYFMLIAGVIIGVISENKIIEQAIHGFIEGAVFYLLAVYISSFIER